jgi:hypothetical protein
MPRSLHRARTEGPRVIARIQPRAMLRRTRRMKAARRRMQTARGLAVGVVSRNAVDAAIEVAYETRAPVMLVASRRQVDSEEFGGGYVEGWTTQAFVRYVRSRDRSNRVSLCRDHGGPWQHPSEVQARLPEREALRSALVSLEADITSRLDAIHIDTSGEIEGRTESGGLVDRLLFLYERASEYARGRGLPLTFEIGCEEQSPEIHSRAQLEASIFTPLEALRQSALPRPRYVVVQTGTKVVETRNVGQICAADDRQSAGGQLRGLVDLCHDRSVAVKAHNCDYLDECAWGTLRRAGVDAVNVAPEYGVVETGALLDALRRTGMVGESERFLELAYESGMWRKWMASTTSASDYERAVISGHYVFSSPQFAIIRGRLERRYRGGAYELDRELRTAIKRRLTSHLQQFGLA